MKGGSEMTKIFDKEQNRREREWFIDYWVGYIKSHSDREWSRQQADLIDSVL